MTVGMVYNPYPGYPTYPTYQQYQYQPQQIQQMAQMQTPMQPGQQYGQPIQGPGQMQQATDERIWVSGEGAANAYLVAANGFVRLWDSTAPVFYEKSADATGKPLPMIAYDYKRRGGEPAKPTPTVDYTGQIKALEEQDSALERRIEALERKLAPKRKEDTDESNGDD